MEYTQAELMEIINDHQKWLAGSGGSRADLSGADLSSVDLLNVNLSCAKLCGVDLNSANLSNADLSYTDLSYACLSYAILRCTNLSGACLRGSTLSGADLSGANMSGIDLEYVDLSEVDLSGIKGLLNPIEYIKENFEKTEDGIIVYTSFGKHFALNPNPNWEIAEGSIIEEVVNPLPTVSRGCGINVATKEWARDESAKRPVWKCLIRWEWLAGVVVPYQVVVPHQAEEAIRASRVQLIKPI
jgi:uncharacterized protein YjbI with pentapeptide repeats